MKAQSVYNQIETIRRQLWLGHASLMVGSGLSRNADKASPTTPTPPDWTELGDKLIEALYPKAGEAERAAMRTSKNTLQLADEFDMSYQRPALNALLKKHIQDDNLLPSKLHVEILKLPWADVFTTNYDTLLERAARQVTSIKYDIVLNCGDLPYSEAPRIIKLHGSFPTEATHLIISEEDYRTYPEQYSPFVNTVQQAIMETALCLVGFSGTDPNFRKWIGWVKDNLHGSMPPVFLVGMFDLPITERRLLESKNIVPVDLSELDGISDGDYSTALDAFISLLNKQPDYYNWPEEKPFKLISPGRHSTSADHIEAIKTWRRERKTYPNWIVLPWKKRAIMKTYTEHWALNSIGYLKELPGTWDIQGLYELDWRLGKCLMPVFNSFIADYEAIIGKYDPFGLKDPGNKNKALQGKWLSLCFSVLRWSREEFEEETWKKYESIIQKVLQKEEDVYSLNRLYYEQAFHAMTLPDLDLFDAVMREWFAIRHPLLWKVKIASVLYMMDEKNKARTLWMEALNELRPHVPKNRIKDDFYLLSIEGSILVDLFLSSSPGSSRKPEDNTEELREDCKSRLQELAPIGCSPWEEIERFALSLESPRDTVCSKEYFRDFNCQQTTIHFFNCWQPLPVLVYQYLRFFEEAGIPFLSDKTMRQSLSFLSNYSPWWTFCILNIIGTAQISTCEIVFSQEKIFHLPHERINSLVGNYVCQMRHLISKKRKHLTLFNSNLYSKLANNLFETISRLTIKSTPDNLQMIFDLGIELYRINDEMFFFKRLGSRYFCRLFEAMQPQQIFRNLNDLLSIPIPSRQISNWESPALFVDWRGFKVSPEALTPQLKNTIQNLIEKLDTDNASCRSEVLHYLNVCSEVGLLPPSSQKTIAKVLRKHLTPPVFPQIANNYYFVYKKLLAPLKKDRETDDVLKNYYFQASLNVFEQENGNIRLSLMSESEFLRMSKSLLATCSVFNRKEWMFFDLTSEECETLYHNIRTSLEQAKDSMDRLLNSPQLFYDGKESIRNTFQTIDKLLGEVIVPRVKDRKTLQDILSFTREFEEKSRFPVTAVAFMAKKDRFDEAYIVETVSAFSESDNTVLRSYAYSIYNSYRFAQQKELPEPPLKLLNSLISAVNMKSDVTFCTVCGILGSILSVYSPPDTECRMILSALKDLLRATSFSDENERFSVQNRYDYRQAAAYLAASMYLLCRKKRIRIPPVLQEWYDLRDSKDELPDIRNTWMRTLNCP